MKETVFAISSGYGKSGVAVIRISGDDAYKAIDIMVSTKQAVTARKAVLCHLVSVGSREVIDEALLLYFPSPHSFTGENIVEFHTHGSIAVVKEVIDNLGLINNFRPADPGEFSRRAFENGKMDLTEAEALCDLIEAETKMQLKQAIRQKEGILGNLCNLWRESLINILAYTEAYVDFPDEEIPSDLSEKAASEVASMKESISKYLDAGLTGEKIRDGLHLVILGEVNSGKSSLINYLAKRDIAIVSNIEGTTRDVIELHTDIDGYPVTIADTAGIRLRGENSVEEEGMERALKKAENADYKIIMFDVSKLSKSVPDDILDLIDEDSFIVINKMDSLSDSNISENSQKKIDLKDLVKDSRLFEKLKNFDPVYISVKENRGMDLFLKELKRITEKNFSNSEHAVITKKRHRLLFEETVFHLNQFSLDKPIELYCEDLRLASVALGRVTGIIDTEEVLENIFSKFCIGK